MICPVEIAHEMSALRAAKIGDHAEHGDLSEGRDGAGDESTGRNVAGDGEEDHLVGAPMGVSIHWPSGDQAGRKSPPCPEVSGLALRVTTSRIQRLALPAARVLT